MNRKNRMAQLASQASTSFNTYSYFKVLQEKHKQLSFQTAVVMRITQAGVYVMVQKYGIEGLLAVNEDIEQTQRIETNTDKEEAYLPSEGDFPQVLKVFDPINVQIIAKMVEFRRSILLIYSPEKTKSAKSSAKKAKKQK